MAKDDRGLLELLKDGLAFIQQGGYGRSVRTPWLPKSIFQDTPLTCLNYGYPYRAHPGAECWVVDPDIRDYAYSCPRKSPFDPPTWTSVKRISLSADVRRAAISLLYQS